MKRLETFIFRVLLITVLAVISISPLLAATHVLHGLVSRSIDVTHFLSLGYLLLIALGLFLISPVFGDQTHKQRT